MPHMCNRSFVSEGATAPRPAPQRRRRRWLALGVAVCAACTVAPLPGGVTDTPTETTTAADAGGETLGATSGLPLDSTIASLSSTDAATLCDWVNGKRGGYGRPSVFCPGAASKSTSLSQLTCVNGFAALGNRCLDLTVGTVEDCVNATGSDLCLEESTPACMTIGTCGLGM
jgi:hypothetical protein